MSDLSVAVTTHNRWDTCRESIISVGASENVNIEIIVIDDASEYEMPEELSIECSTLTSKVVRHDSNKGLSSARNTALNYATAKYFSFCDDDDKWPKGLANLLVSAMKSAPKDVGMAIVLRPELKRCCGYLFEGFPRLSELMQAGLTPPVGSQIYCANMLRDLGGYRPEITSGVDHDLWVSLARIDPRVAVAWGEPAIVGNDPSKTRMTTVESRRRCGIEKSLIVWRDDLCEVFGEAFYKHFVRSYRWYLDYSFLINSIKKGEYLDVLYRAIKAPKLTCDVLASLYARASNRPRCTLFPAFKGKLS